MQRRSFASFEYVAPAELLMARDLSTYFLYAWLFDSSDVMHRICGTSERIKIVKLNILNVNKINWHYNKQAFQMEIILNFEMPTGFVS